MQLIECSNGRTSTCLMSFQKLILKELEKVRNDFCIFKSLKALSGKVRVVGESRKQTYYLKKLTLQGLGYAYTFPCFA